MKTTVTPTMRLLCRLPGQGQLRTPSSPLFAALIRHCSGSGEQGSSGGSSTIDRHNETKGAMSSYLKSSSAKAPSGGAKPWLKNLKQQQDKPHTQYFAADDPNAKSKARAGSSSDGNAVVGGDSSYSLDDDAYDGEGDDNVGRGGRKSRRRRGDDDEAEDKALDKQRQERDDGDPKRGISPTVRNAPRLFSFPL